MICLFLPDAFPQDPSDAPRVRPEPAPGPLPADHAAAGDLRLREAPVDVRPARLRLPPAEQVPAGVHAADARGRRGRGETEAAGALLPAVGLLAGGAAGGHGTVHLFRVEVLLAGDGV